MRFEQTCITVAIIINELSDFKIHHYRKLAEIADVSRRTIANYIKALRARGYPIKSIFTGDKRGVCIDPKYIDKGKVIILACEYDNNIDDEFNEDQYTRSYL